MLALGDLAQFSTGLRRRAGGEIMLNWRDESLVGLWSLLKSSCSIIAV